MQRTSPTEADSAIVKLSDWFQSPAGEYVRQWEQQRLDALVDDIFGYVAVQVGVPAYDALRRNRIPFHAYVGPTLPKDDMAKAWHSLAAARPEALPLASQSVDLLILPHVLEYACDPHRVLREAERVLRPEGHLIILGFNPWSLWGARHRLAHRHWLPGDGRFIGLPQLKDWLKLLSFELDRGHFGCYALPVRSARWLARSHFLDKAGDRWWPVAGAVYLITAVKRVPGVRLLGPAWKTQRRRAPARGQIAARRTPASHPFPSRHDNN